MNNANTDTLISYSKAYPLDFNLYDKNDRNLLYMVDTPLAQSYQLKIRNTYTESLTLTPLSGDVGADNYHFVVHFRRSTLSSACLTAGAKQLKLDPNAGAATNWQMRIAANVNGTDRLYFLTTTAITLDPETMVSIPLVNLTADVNQGTRGSRMELRTDNMHFLDGVKVQLQRETHLLIVNHRGSARLPMDLSFVGGNAVLNDGRSPNNLTLHLRNLLTSDRGRPAHDKLTFRYHDDLAKRSKLIISFDTNVKGDGKADSALGTAKQLNAIQIAPPAHWVVHKNSEGITTTWTITPEKDQVLAAGGHVEITINNIITEHTTGRTHATLYYENIPGYWDGQLVADIEKQPLVFKGKQVGIGTLSPTSALEVKGSVKIEHLDTSAIGIYRTQQKIHASGEEQDDFFGHSVAISGDWAVVGAYRKEVKESRYIPGCAYIFQRNPSTNTWKEQQVLLPSDTELHNIKVQNDDRFDLGFGYSVAIDGDWVIVGCNHKHSRRGKDGYIGGAYLFQRDSVTNIWGEPQKIHANDQEGYDFFGRSVAISGDWAVVGAHRQSTGALGAGSAYLFQRDSTTNIWGQSQKIQAKQRYALDYFGSSVAINGDWAIIGAYGAYGKNKRGKSCGCAYTFYRNSSSNTWEQSPEPLIASDAGFIDNFGHSVSIQGDWAIVGAYRDDLGDDLDAGSAYLFRRNGNTWKQQQKIYASDKQRRGRYFGSSVAINGDWAVVGACLDALVSLGRVSHGSSTAYLFRRQGNTWMEERRLQDSGPEKTAPFATAVAIEGMRIIIGSFHKKRYTGSANIFDIESKNNIVTLNEEMGNVGIGVADPQSRLEINGGIKAQSLDVSGQIKMQSLKVDGKVDSKSLAIAEKITSQSLDVSGQTKTQSLIVDGKVGIGTTNPAMQLEIKGGVDQYLSYGWLNKNGRTGNSSGTNPYSLYASERIAASEFNAHSDARIKTIQGATNNTADLQTLLKLEITDYHYKDSVQHGNTPQKKVIGQQVAKVFPQAVDNNNTQVVPDIMQQAIISAQGEVTLPGHHLKPGDRVRFIYLDQEQVSDEIHTIKDSSDNSFSLDDYKPGKVLVYGREVDDFHIVDLEALAMLNISATQELYKMIQELKNIIEEITQQKNNHANAE